VNRPTHTLLVGIALAAVVLVAGAYNHHRLIRVASNAKVELPKLEAAHDACSKRYAAAHPYTGPGMPIDWVFAERSECGTAPSATELDERLQTDLHRSDYWTWRVASCCLPCSPRRGGGISYCEESLNCERRSSASL